MSIFFLRLGARQRPRGKLGRPLLYFLFLENAQNFRKVCDISRRRPLFFSENARNFAENLRIVWSEGLLFFLDTSCKIVSLVLGLERDCFREVGPLLWPRIFFVSMASILESSAPPPPASRKIERHRLIEHHL